MSELTPAQLIGAGTQITLTNGNTLTLRYGFGAMAALEEKHGSLKVFSDIMQQGEKGPIFSVLGHALWAGTERKMPLNAFMDLLNPGKSGEYVEAFSNAFNEAMGEVPGEAKAVEKTA
jgi:hypothetical protein